MAVQDIWRQKKNVLKNDCIFIIQLKSIDLQRKSVDVKFPHKIHVKWLAFEAIKDFFFFSERFSLWSNRFKSSDMYFIGIATANKIDLRAKIQCKKIKSHPNFALNVTSVDVIYWKWIEKNCTVFHTEMIFVQKEKKRLNQ